MNSLLEYPQLNGEDWTGYRSGIGQSPSQQSLAVSKLKKQPGSVIPFRGLADQELEHAKSLPELRKLYVLPSDDTVPDFLFGRRSLSQLIIDAKQHLEQYFGVETVFSLQCSIDDSGAQTLYVVAMWPGKATEAKAALDNFDEHWWLSNPRPSSGLLAFTYELV